MGRRCAPLVAILISLLAGCRTAPADGERPPEAGPDSPLRGAALDAEVGRLMRAARVPGLAIAVLDAGEVVHLKAYGTRNAEAGLPLETDTVMYGASLTKGVFAIRL